MSLREHFWIILFQKNQTFVCCASFLCVFIYALKTLTASLLDVKAEVEADSFTLIQLQWCWWTEVAFSKPKYNKFKRLKSEISLKFDNSLLVFILHLIAFRKIEYNILDIKSTFEIFIFTKCREL